ncbi:hypothetical protein K0M31_018900 [Melipona bicolor]|uniref:Uncharacterized protein n=1 Tax=Melipona bicolor TaxID=60889 RepID=A0AA40G493_9HYME|nr:hypothetical protein K0M31_018900 [Melipona bicolor]
MRTIDIEMKNVTIIPRWTRVVRRAEEENGGAARGKHVASEAGARCQLASGSAVRMETRPHVCRCLVLVDDRPPPPPPADHPGVWTTLPLTLSLCVVWPVLTD